MTCPNCGTDDPGDTGYCKNCGRAVAVAATKTSVGQIIFALFAGFFAGLFLMGGLAMAAVFLSAVLKVQKSPIFFVAANAIPVIGLILFLASKQGRNSGAWMLTFIVTTLVVCLGALSICTVLLTSLGTMH